MVLAAGRAAGEVLAHPRHGGVGVAAGELELDVAVELLEALLAGELVLCRAEQSLQYPAVLLGVQLASDRAATDSSPRAARCRRNFLRAS